MTTTAHEHWLLYMRFARNEYRQVADRIKRLGYIEAAILEASLFECEDAE